jgi:hypothetical protein
VTLANQALLACLPERFRTPAITDRFLTPARLVPVPQPELAAREQADKPAAAIQSFALLLAAGLPLKRAHDLAYSVQPDTLAYANVFLDQPTLLLDEQLYRLCFASDATDRQQALCLLGHAVIVTNLAAAPRPRLLPQQPWQAVMHASLNQYFLPAVRHELQEAGTYDACRFATLTSQLLTFLPAQEELQSTDHVLRERINVVVNRLLGDDQPADAVDWEPEAAVRFVAHGAKVLFLLPGQVLPVFEFGTGVALDGTTHAVVVRQAMLDYYARLQQRSQLPVVAQHQRELLQQVPSRPRSGTLEHYLQSDLPEWYLAEQQRPWRRTSDAAAGFVRYPR